MIPLLDDDLLKRLRNRRAEHYGVPANDYAKAPPAQDALARAILSDRAAAARRRVGQDQAVTAYHGTRTAALQSIIDNGLLAHPFKHYHPQQFYRGERGASVYVTENPEIAKRWALSEVDDPADVTILQLELPRDRLRSDEEAPEAERFVGDIPPDWIKSAYPLQRDGTFGAAIPLHHEANDDGPPGAIRYTVLHHDSQLHGTVQDAYDADALGVLLGEDEDPEWDESKVKRSKGGQFAKSAAPKESKEDGGATHISHPHVSAWVKKFGFSGKKHAISFAGPDGSEIKIHPPKKEGQKWTTVWSHHDKEGNQTAAGPSIGSLTSFLHGNYTPVVEIGEGQTGGAGKTKASPPAAPKEPEPPALPEPATTAKAAVSAFADTAKAHGFAHMHTSESGSEYYEKGDYLLAAVPDATEPSATWKLAKADTGETIMQGTEPEHLAEALQQHTQAKPTETKPTEIAPPEAEAALAGEEPQPKPTETPPTESAHPPAPFADGPAPPADFKTTYEGNSIKSYQSAAGHTLYIEDDGSWVLTQADGITEAAKGKGTASQADLDKAVAEHVKGTAAPTETPPAPAATHGPKPYPDHDTAPPAGWGKPVAVGGFAHEYHAPNGDKLFIYHDGEWQIDPKSGADVISGKSQETLDTASTKSLGPAAQTAPTPTTAAAAIPDEPKIGNITPPKGITQLLPHKKSVGGSTYYSDTPTSAEITEQIGIKPNGDWKIWQAGEGTIAEGNGQDSLNQAFEQLHPRDEHGHFIKVADQTTAQTVAPETPSGVSSATAGSTGAASETHGPAPYGGNLAPPAAWGAPFAQTGTAWSYQVGNDYLDIYPDGSWSLAGQQDTKSGNTQAELNAATSEALGTAAAPASTAAAPAPTAAAPAFPGGALSPPAGWTPTYEGATVKTYGGPGGTLLDIYKDGQWTLATANTTVDGKSQAEMDAAVSQHVGYTAPPAAPAAPAAPTTPAPAAPITADPAKLQNASAPPNSKKALLAHGFVPTTYSKWQQPGTNVMAQVYSDGTWELYDNTDNKYKYLGSGKTLGKLKPALADKAPKPSAAQVAQWQTANPAAAAALGGAPAPTAAPTAAPIDTSQSVAPDAVKSPLSTHGFAPSGSMTWQHPSGMTATANASGYWWLNGKDGSALASGNTASDLQEALAQHAPATAAPVQPAAPVAPAKPPTDIDDVLPHKKDLPGAVLYHDAASLGDSTEQITFNDNGSWSIWQDGGQLLEGKGQDSFNQAFESLHPRDEHGHFIKKDTGEAPAAPPKSDKVEHFTDAHDLPPELNGVAFAHWQPPADWSTVAGQKPDLVEPPINNPQGLKVAAGLLIQEPDGRVWLVQPKNQFGGAKYTYPKGGQEADHTLQQTAIKETWEESGLLGEITGLAGDYVGSTSITRYYLAKRIAGTPTGYGEESEGVTLVPADQLSQYLTHNRDKKIAANHLTSTAPAAPALPAGVTASTALNLAQMTKVGKQLGSNPGGQYEAPDGTKYYVKQLKSDDHVNNEMLAAALYKAAGGNTFEYSKVLDDGKLALATKWAPLAKSSITEFSAAERKAAQQDFAIQAWLGNRDAAGIDNTNIGVTQDGKVVPTDLGGSLLFRAQGLPKTLDAQASEWESLRDAAINQQTHALYGSMTPAELAQSADRLKAVSDAMIDKLVAQYAPSDPNQQAQLAQTLKQRRDAIVKKAAPPAPPPQTGLTKQSAGAEKERLAQHAPKRTGKVQSAITAYKGSDYHEMNACARFLEDCEDERVIAMDKHYANTSLPAAMLYRGIKPDPTYVAKVHVLLNKYGPGGPKENPNKPLQLPDEGFCSTSTWREFSDNWRHNDPKGLLFEIEAPEGFKGDVVYPNAYDHEHEVILPRGSRFEVTGWNKATGVIKCRLVQDKIKTGEET